jgi:hypothetical protein
MHLRWFLGLKIGNRACAVVASCSPLRPPWPAPPLCSGSWLAAPRHSSSGVVVSSAVRVRAALSEDWPGRTTLRRVTASWGLLLQGWS